MDVLRTDCLVIGAGLAGTTYALEAARLGLRCELLSLGGPLEANSDWAQGGIIYDTSPDPEALARDIAEAGDHLNNPLAVAQLVREGPRAVEEMLIGGAHVDFDRDAAGHLDRTREGGHGERRIIHAKDATGHAILAAVAARVAATPLITRRTGAVAVDLLTLSSPTTTGRSPASGPTSSIPPPAGSAPWWRRRRSSPAAAWGRSSSTRPTSRAASATGSRWRTGSARG